MLCTSRSSSSWLSESIHCRSSTTSSTGPRAQSRSTSDRRAFLCQLSPAQRIVGGEGAVLGEGAEQGLQRGHRLLEAEIAHGGRDPIPDHLGRLVLREEEVLAQQLQDGEVRDALAVGDGGGLEHHAPGRRRGVDELEEQPGLADADLTDHRGDAAVAGEHPLLDARELVHLQLASHEVGEAAQRRHLDAPHRARAHELEDLDRRVASAHGERAERLGVEQGLGEGEGGAREPDGPGGRHLLHPGGQVCRLADGGEIHVRSLSIARTTTTPEFSPTRIATDGPLSRARSRARARTPSCMSRAA
jgi:hypothetical protein